MSESTVLLLIAVVWLTIGIVLSVVMGRRGYDTWNWLIVGAILGPLAILLAATTRPAPPAATTAVTTTHSADGRVDVLVGVDGSPQSEAAIRGVDALFGDRLGRLTLASVIPLDAPPLIDQQAHELLDRVAALAGDRAERVLLRGRPAIALRELAAAGHYDVLAIGRVGHGLSKALLGSTATDLAHEGGLPVLLFGEHRRVEGPEPSGLAAVVADA
jgi:nucleotide-binding universal stress UspA family protein